MPERPATDFNQRVIDEFRANGGAVGGRFHDTPLILITTEGRHSHRPRTNPVTYVRDGTRYLIVGSNLGRPTHPGWYHNLLASPQVTMEIGTDDGQVSTLAARAVILHGAERDRRYELLCAGRPVFRDYQEKTTRTIPVVALQPLELTDNSERSRMLAEQLVAHHNSLRARLHELRAEIATFLGDRTRGTALALPDLTAQLRQHCLSYCYGLQLHHTREDGTFSAVERTFPHLIPIVSRLRSEHRVMAQALADLEALLNKPDPGDTGEILAALDRTITGLEEHFSYEDAQLLAALGRIPTQTVDGKNPSER